MKIERYFEIFQMLSPDSNGFISFECINIHQLEPLVFKTIQPLLDELEHLDHGLSFQELCDALDNLMKTLSPVEKDVISHRKRQKPQENSNFSIKRCKSLEEISENSIYKREQQNNLLRAAKLERERKSKAQKETENCTFRPQIKEFKVSKQYYQ